MPRPITTKVDDAGHCLGNPLLREKPQSPARRLENSQSQCRRGAYGRPLASRLSSTSQLGRVDLGAGSLDEMLRLLVERIAASDQYLSVRQHGHGFAEA